MIITKAVHQVVSIVLIASVAVGCVTTHYEKVARLTPTAELRTQVIDEPGVYKVRWRRTSTEKLQTVAGTSRYLTVGTAVGFERQTDGSIVAIAGDERIALPAGPADAKYVMWHARWKEPSDLAVGAANVGRGVLTVLGVATVLGLVGVTYALDSGGDDCDR